MPARGLLGVLEAMEILTPAKLERFRRRAEKTGAVRAANAIRAYQQVTADYKAGKAKPLALAHAHAELLQALEQNGREVRGVFSRLADVFQSARGAKR